MAFSSFTNGVQILRTRGSPPVSLIRKSQVHWLLTDSHDFICIQKFCLESDGFPLPAYRDTAEIAPVCQRYPQIVNISVFVKYKPFHLPRDHTAFDYFQKNTFAGAYAVSHDFETLQLSDTVFNLRDGLESTSLHFRRVPTGRVLKSNPCTIRFSPKAPSFTGAPFALNSSIFHKTEAH